MSSLNDLGQPPINPFQLVTLSDIEFVDDKKKKKKRKQMKASEYLADLRKFEADELSALEFKTVQAFVKKKEMDGDRIESTKRNLNNLTLKLKQKGKLIDTALAQHLPDHDIHLVLKDHGEFGVAAHKTLKKLGKRAGIDVVDGGFPTTFSPVSDFK